MFEQYEKNTVLVVDDNAVNRLLLVEYFNMYGVNADEAHDGKSSIRFLKNNPNMDMIFMDYMMPEMNGYETMLEIRKISKYKKTPIILCSANGGAIPDNEQVAFDYNLQKPFKIKEFESVLKKFLKIK